MIKHKDSIILGLNNPKACNMSLTNFLSSLSVLYLHSICHNNSQYSLFMSFGKDVLKLDINLFSSIFIFLIQLLSLIMALNHIETIYLTNYYQ